MNEIFDHIEKLLQPLAVDMERFANHADRTTVNEKDVLLCSRRDNTVVSIYLDRYTIILPLSIVQTV